MMQDMTFYHQQSSMMAAARQQQELPEQEQLKCPRCDSPNTKFCYYNNYNLSQPRHFCKNCRRYWTKGGSLRNIPVGGGSRKNTKRSSSSTSSSNLKNKTKPSSESDSGSVSGSKVESFTGISGQEMDPTRMLPVGESFSSLLASHMQMGGVTCETGSRWYPGTGLGLGLDSGIRRSDDAWTDLAMVNRVEKD